MKYQNVATFLGITAVTLSLISITGEQAHAGTLYQNWNYSIDSFNDGSGGSNYEIKGMAIKETSDSIFVALTGGTPLTGVTNSGANDGNVGWGDLFFNFTGNGFKAASESKNLFGVRFAGTNDSNAASTGVYKNVQATSVATANHGYSSLQQYYNSGWESTNTQGTDLPTRAAAENYFGTGSILNVIGSGERVGDISLLDAAGLTTAGLNFGNFSALGSQVIGFQFDKALIGIGNYIANTFLECGNDGVALAGETKVTPRLPVVKDVPEPVGTAGLAVAGLAWVGTQWRRRHQLRGVTK